MSFFEPPPPPPEVPVHRQPEWIGPPENVLPAPVPLAVTLVHTADVAIAVHGLLAYPNGFSFRVALVRRTPLDFGDPFHARMPGAQDALLRFGIQFADGAKATTFDQHRWLGTRTPPTGPVLMHRGGGGGGRSWDYGFWVWPVPPDGPLAFVAEWPSEQIELTRAEIDGAAIRSAAARAETLWPDDDGPSPGGGSFVSMRQIS